LKSQDSFKIKAEIENNTQWFINKRKKEKEEELKKNTGENKMELEVKQEKKIEDGLHKGVIIGAVLREKPFKYIDVIIEFENLKLKSGYPAIILESSKLGQLLQRFGIKLDIGSKIDVEKVLIGKPCQFMTIKKEKYSNIISDSVKPI
jgi:hypothetical protein